MTQTQTKKTCSECGEDKEASDFYKNVAGLVKLKNWCKGCVCKSGYWSKMYHKYKKKALAKKKLMYLTNKDEIIMKHKRYRANETVKFRGSMRDFRKRYELPLTVDEIISYYNKQFAKQKGCCAICGRHETEFNRRLDTDHNHDTDELRGLLCSNCNFGIGNLQDDAELCLKAYQYLRKH